VDNVVSVESYSKQIVIVKLALGERLVSVFLVYVLRSGKPDEEKESIQNDVFMKVECVHMMRWLCLLLI